MPYRVTFSYRKKRYASADVFETKNKAKWLKDAFSGLNPRIVPVEGAEACPRGFKKETTGRCVKP